MKLGWGRGPTVERGQERDRMNDGTVVSQPKHLERHRYPCELEPKHLTHGTQTAGVGCLLWE